MSALPDRPFSERDMEVIFGPPTKPELVVVPESDQTDEVDLSQFDSSQILFEWTPEQWDAYVTDSETAKVCASGDYAAINAHIVRWKVDHGGVLPTE